MLVCLGLDISRPTIHILLKVINVHNITVTYFEMHLGSNEGCPFCKFNTNFREKLISWGKAMARLTNYSVRLSK